MKNSVNSYIALLILLVMKSAGVHALSTPMQAYEYVAADNKVEYKIKDSSKTKGILKNVDLASFVIINSSYAKDKSTVFFENTIIQGASPHSFYMIEKNGYDSDYSSDNAHVYYRGRQVSGLDPKHIKFKTYVVDQKTYASDYVEGKKFMYQYGEKLPWLDKNSLEIIGAGYLKDKNSVYYRSNPPSGIDVKTYVILENKNYLKDHKQAYYQGKVIQGSDAASFMALKSSYLDQDFAKDKHSVYFNGTKIDADPENFKLLADVYAKDKRSVFFWQNGNNGVQLITLNGRDTETFEVLEPSHISKDKFSVYAQNVKMEYANPATFKTLNAVYSKDEKNVYLVFYKLDSPVIIRQQRFHAPSFELVEYLDDNNEVTHYFLKDKNAVYASNEYSEEIRVIENADTDTFHFLESDWYTADDRHVYYLGYLIQGADTSTFQILEENFSKDKDRVYFQGRPTDYDVKTFKVIGFDSGKLVVEDKNGKKDHCVINNYVCMPE